MGSLNHSKLTCRYSLALHELFHFNEAECRGEDLYNESTSALTENNYSLIGLEPLVKSLWGEMADIDTGMGGNGASITRCGQRQTTSEAPGQFTSFMLVTQNNDLCALPVWLSIYGEAYFNWA